MGARRSAREAALQMLYLTDMGRLSAQEAEAAILDHGKEKPDAKSRDFAVRLLEGTLKELPTLDALITRYAKNWEFKRIAAVDRDILRLASYELLHDLETPVNVTIDEALEISKKYSSKDSSRFINGILDQVKENRKA